MIDEVNVNDESQEQVDVVEEGNDTELSYEDAFEQEWGKDTTEQEVEVETEPTPEEEEPEEVAEVDTPETGDAGSADTEVESQEQESAPAPKSDDPYSWINSLPDEVKGQAEALKHAALSDQGRVAAYNRRIADLQADLDRMSSRQSAEQQSQKPQGKSAPAADELPEKFKQLKEDFPEFADAVEEIRELDRQRFQHEIDARLQPLNEQQAKQAKSEFDDAVEREAEKIFNTQETGVHWRDIVAGEDFRAWLDTQPRSVQVAARTPDPTEAVFVLNQYEKDYQAAIAAMNPPADTGATETDSSSAPTKADKAQAQRKKRQTQARGVSSRPAPSPADNEGGDYDKEFDRMWG